MKKITTVLFLLLTLHGFSQLYLKQEHLGSLNFKTKEDETTLDLYNEDQQELTLFTTQKKQLLVNILDRSFKLIRSFEVDRPGKNDANLMGALRAGDSILIVYSNKLFTGLSSQYINLKTGEMHPYIHEDKINYQRFLASEMINNVLYIVSIRDNQSDLYVYKIYPDRRMEIIPFAFGDKKFMDLTYDYYLYDLLEKGNVFMQKISREEPNGIAILSAQNKIYFHGDEIILTSDYFRHSTKYIRLNLADSTTLVKDFQQPEIERDITIPGHSNSYVFEGYISQISASALEMAVTVKSIYDSQLIRTFRVSLTDTMSLNNTGITQKGSAYPLFSKKERELKYTEQVLRKLGRSDIGIGVFDIGDSYEVTIGGIIEVTHPPVGFVVSPSAGPTMYTGMPDVGYYSATTYNLYSSLRTKSVHFHSLIEKETFEKIDIPFEDNMFDAVVKYIEMFSDNFFVEHIFKIKTDYYMLYYVKDEKKHNLVRLVPE